MSRESVGFRPISRGWELLFQSCAIRNIFNCIFMAVFLWGSSTHAATPSPEAVARVASGAAGRGKEGKLAHKEQLRASLAQAERIPVIVTLEHPLALWASTDLDTKASAQAYRGEVQRIRQRALATLPANHVVVRRVFDNLTGFSAEVTSEGLAALEESGDVLAVEPVVELEPHLAQGLALIRANDYRSQFKGAGLSIAICDTGVDYNHPKLGGGRFPNSKVIGGYDFGNDDADPAPGHAHGTACAGIAAGDLGTTGDYVGGVAPEAKIYALKISMDNTGSATSEDMVAAWDWCITHRNDDPANPIMVISTSFGGGKYSLNCDSSLPAMTTAANLAVAAGITIFASSGNDGYCNAISWPACISSVIAVGGVYDAAFGQFSPCISAESCVSKTASSTCSTGQNATDQTSADRVASYANSAPILGLLAPANQTSTLDNTGVAGYTSGDYVNGFGGTSAACPYAAGAAAVLQSAAKATLGRFLTPVEVQARLVASGNLVTDPKSSITKPRINIGAALSILLGATPTLTINSVNPSTGVTIDLSPVDRAGQGAGVTLFSRTYNQGQSVTLSAPAIVARKPFLKWQQDGRDYSTQAVTTVLMDASHTLTAFYGAETPETTFIQQMTPGTERNDFTGFVGMRFQVGASAMTITQLGRMMLAGNTGSHVVKLVDASTGRDITGASVTINMAGGTPGQFRYAPLLMPLSLPAGAIVYLVSQETYGGDRWYEFDTRVMTAPEATVLSGVYGSSSIPWSYAGGSGQTYVPVDMKYQGTPPPVTRTLSVNSTPASGVSIAVYPQDIQGLMDGPTPLSRTFYDGVMARVTAPALSGSLSFVKWQKDGVDYATTLTTAITMDASTSMTAVYAAQADPSLITNTVLGTIRNDYTGFVGMRLLIGSTPLVVSELGRMVAPGNSRSHVVKLVRASTGADVPGGSTMVSTVSATAGQYAYGALAAAVTLAPYTAYYLLSQETSGGDSWHEVNSIVHANSSATVQGGVYGQGMGAYYHYGAPGTAYVPVNLRGKPGAAVARTLQLNSLNPSSGVQITCSSADLNGISSAPSPSTRSYVGGTVLTVSAPAQANGASFLKWTRSGTNYSSGQNIVVTISENTELTAVYTTVVASSNWVTNAALGTLRSNYGSFVGMRFNTGPQALTITELGRMAAPGNSGSHLVKLVLASTGQDVPGASVQVSMLGAAAGNFQFANLASPVVLQPNTIYYLVSKEVSGGDAWYEVDTVVSTSCGTVLGGLYGSGPGAWYTYGSTGQAYVPLSFRYQTGIAPQPLIQNVKPGTVRSNYTGYVGARLQIGTNPLTVTSLGRMMLAGNSRTHTVKLVDGVTGQDLPGGTAVVSMPGGVPGEFRYEKLAAPVVLKAGATYYLVTQETIGGDTWYEVDTTATAGQNASITGGMYGSGSSPWYSYGGTNQLYGPVNLIYQP